LWTDGKLGAYVRYVADGQRFGFRDENILAAIEIPLGEDAYVCPSCGKETAANSEPDATSDGSALKPVILSPQAAGEGSQSTHDRGASDDEILRDAEAAPLRMTAVGCKECGAELSSEHLRRAERVTVPRVVGTRRVANGQEEIAIVGGLELNTPVWANEMHEYPYLQSNVCSMPPRSFAGKLLYASNHVCCCQAFRCAWF